MKLFYAPGSSSLFPHIVLLHEAELPFTAIKINEHSKVIEGGGDYKKVSPLGYVPALVLDDGTLLTEGAAIVQYIADQVPSKKLVPPNGTIERAMLQAWLNFCSSEMHKGGFSPLFYKGVPEEGKKVFRTRLVARFNYLDEHLKSNEYLMGRDYSVPTHTCSSYRIGRAGCSLIYHPMQTSFRIVGALVRVPRFVVQWRRRVSFLGPLYSLNKPHTSGHLRQGGGSHMAVHVRFAPKATEVLRRRELPRCASLCPSSSSGAAAVFATYRPSVQQSLFQSAP